MLNQLCCCFKKQVFFGTMFALTLLASQGIFWGNTTSLNQTVCQTTIGGFYCEKYET